jgi:uncharacterized protein (DUF58 family)
MIRPTLRGVLLFAASLPFAILVLGLWPARWVYGIDASLIAFGAIVLDSLMCAHWRRVTAEVAAPARIWVGSPLAVAVAVGGAARARSVEIVADLTGPIDPAPTLVAPIDGGGGGTVTAPLRVGRRGVIDIAALWLRWSGPLGLACRIKRIEINKRIEVLPDIRSVQNQAILFSDRDAVDGIKIDAHKGEGSEFEALREHVAGMDNRFIDWKQSAKHRKLLSKEFRVERNHQIVLAYDTGRLMAEPIGALARLDHAIHAGLQLGWVSLRNGDFVGSYGFDARIRHYLQPSRGARAFGQLQRGASQLGYFAEETNYTLGLAELNARLKRRALVVLFTEFVDTTTAQLMLDSVQRVANRHAVVFVTLTDPFLAATVNAPPRDFPAVASAIVAFDLMRERAIVLERLQRMGVQCLDAPTRGLAVALVNRYLAIKRRGLL